MTNGPWILRNDNNIIQSDNGDDKKIMTCILNETNNQEGRKKAYLKNA